MKQQQAATAADTGESDDRASGVRIAGSSSPSEEYVITDEFDGVQIPRTRGDCLPGGHNAERPCPFARCKYHFAIRRINGRSRTPIMLEFPERELDELPETCVLDIADRGGITLDGAAKAFGLVRERVRQIEDAALRKVREARSVEQRELRDWNRGTLHLRVIGNPPASPTGREGGKTGNSSPDIKRSNSAGSSGQADSRQETPMGPKGNSEGPHVTAPHALVTGGSTPRIGRQ